jgi:murein DD-endopeptidase MepM/ murein hydrolase activator NlpD
MKKCLFLITLSLILNNLTAQTELGTYKAVAGRFENFYNAERYDSIFSLFSSEMKGFLPEAKTATVLGSIKTSAGKITRREFLKYQDSYAVYKTKFERGIMTVNISIDNNEKINGLYFKPFTEENLPKLERNSTKLILPFKDEWFVFWGGDTKELNYHVESAAQKNAFDFVIKDEAGKSFKTDGQKNEDYYVFGREIISPCDAEVMQAVDGVKDNKPGELNPIYLPGNSVILKTEKNEFMLLAHFKQGSVKVRQGDKIKQGQLLGLCGNSGNSSEPHLHFHIQNVENMNIATGVKCYFDKINVNGQVKTDYSPIKNDRIKN